MAIEQVKATTIPLLASQQGPRSAPPRAPTVQPAPAPEALTSDTSGPQELKVTSAQADNKDRQVSNEDIQQFVNELQKQNVKRALTFSLDEDSGATIIKVIDRNTDEVIRQIPREEFLRVQNAVSKSIGMILNESA